LRDKNCAASWKEAELDSDSTVRLNYRNSRKTMAFSGLARQSLERPTYGELKPQLLGAQLLQVHPAYSVPRNKLHSEGYKKIFPKMSLCDSGCTNLFIESLSLWSKPQKKDLVQSLVSPVTLLISLQL
jgi:hypothetical protein